MINWQINIFDLLAIIGAALVFYGRLVTLETKMDPIWQRYQRRNDRTSTE